jgi:hypothetical protein
MNIILPFYPHRLNEFINIPAIHTLVAPFLNKIKHFLNIPISHFCCSDSTYCHPGLHPVVFVQTPCFSSQKLDKHPSHD